MTDRPDDDGLAADYVLGHLEDGTREAVERRASSDPAFAHRVAQWRARLADFDTTAEESPCPADLWSRIERDVATSPAEQARVRVDAPVGVLSRFWSNLAALRVTALGSAAAALALAVVAGAALQHARDEAVRKPVYVAVLVDDATRQAGAVVNTFANGSAVMIPLTDIAVPEGRVLEIWTLWDRAVGPRSIGLIDRARSVRLQLDNLPPTGADQLFEITLEPAGGSPIGRPTGPILYKGTTTRTL